MDYVDYHRLAALTLERLLPGSTMTMLQPQGPSEAPARHVLETSSPSLSLVFRVVACIGTMKCTWLIVP